MSPATYAVLALILLGALFVVWLALQDPYREPLKHRRPSGDLLLDHSNDLEDWPGAVADPADHQAWLRSMTDPQTPEDYARAHEGAERLRAAMHEQALVEADAFLREMTDGES